MFAIRQQLEICKDSLRLSPCYNSWSFCHHIQRCTTSKDEISSSHNLRTNSSVLLLRGGGMCLGSRPGFVPEEKVGKMLGGPYSRFRCNVEVKNSWITHDHAPPEQFLLSSRLSSSLKCCHKDTERLSHDSDVRSVTLWRTARDILPLETPVPFAVNLSRKLTPWRAAAGLNSERLSTL